MKDSFISTNIKALLSLIIIVSGMSYFYMCSIRDIKPDPQVIIAVVSLVTAVTGYWFGSSSGSAKKDETLADSVNKPVVNNAENVTVK